MPRFVPRRWLVLLLGLLAFIFATSCAPAGAVASSGSTGARQAEESGRGVARTAPPAPANAPAAAPQPETAPSFTAEEALEHVSELAGTIGPRPAGSSAAVTAADYIAGELAGYGYQVERQPFTFPRFEDRTSTLTATAATAGPAAGDAPAGQSIEAGALVFSASGSVSGPLVFAGFGRPGDIPDGRMTGAIALMERGAEVTFRDKAAAAARAGAVGAVIYNSAPHEFTGSLQVPSAIPVLAVSGDDGRRLREQLDQGPLVAQMEVDAAVEDRPAENVIATRPAAPAGNGRARTIVLGAHYDSVPISPGANDNASGTALLLELARVLAAETPGVTLRFIAFGAEELGLLGSAHYVAGLSPEEQANVVAMLNFDMVGVGDELRVGGDDAIVRLAEEAAEERGWRLSRLERQLGRSSDHASFMAADIPSVFFHVSDDPHYHAPTDVPANVSAERLRQMGEIGAAVVRRLVG